MGKASIGVLLAGAYALGVALLVALALALPKGTLCRVRPTLEAVPAQAQHAAQLARVALHAGGLGVRHLPAALSSTGQRRDYCIREQAKSCARQLLTEPFGAVRTVAPVLVRVMVLPE